jgi:hypothetical protein
VVHAHIVERRTHIAEKRRSSSRQLTITSPEVIRFLRASMIYIRRSLNAYPVMELVSRFEVPVHIDVILFLASCPKSLIVRSPFNKGDHNPHYSCYDNIVSLITNPDYMYHTSCVCNGCVIDEITLCYYDIDDCDSPFGDLYPDTVDGNKWWCRDHPDATLATGNL